MFTGNRFNSCACGAYFTDNMGKMLCVAKRGQRARLSQPGANSRQVARPAAVQRQARQGAVHVGHPAQGVAQILGDPVLILKEPDYRHIPYFFGGNPVETVIKQGKIINP